MPDNPDANLLALVRQSQRKFADADKAMAWLIQEIPKFPAVGKEIIEKWLTEHLRELFSADRTRVRARIVGACSRTNDARSANDLVIVASILTDWPVGFKRLGECTAADLRDGSADMRQQGNSCHARADFYDALAGKVGNATVASRFTADQVSAIWEKLNKTAASAAA